MHTILLVDDEKEVLNYLSEWMRDSGYEVLTASRYHDAQELLSERDINIVICDWSFDFTDNIPGTEFHASMRSKGDETPFILLSGYVVESEEISEPANNFYVISKMRAHEELLQKIEQILDPNS